MVYFWCIFLPVLSSTCKVIMRGQVREKMLYNFHLCRHTCKSVIKYDQVRTSNEYDTDDRF